MAKKREKRRTRLAEFSQCIHCGIIKHQHFKSEAVFDFVVRLFNKKYSGRISIIPHLFKKSCSKLC
jgi:hypothetical protein